MLCRWSFLYETTLPQIRYCEVMKEAYKETVRESENHKCVSKNANPMTCPKMDNDAYYRLVQFESVAHDLNISIRKRVKEEILK